MRQKSIPAELEKILAEEIATLSISYLDESATAGVVSGEIINGEFIPDLSTVIYTDLGRAGFLELTKESTEKQKGEVRRDDIFTVIDKIKSGELNNNI